MPEQWDRAVDRLVVESGDNAGTVDDTVGGWLTPVSAQMVVKMSEPITG